MVFRHLKNLFGQNFRFFLNLQGFHTVPSFDSKKSLVSQAKIVLHVFGGVFYIKKYEFQPKE